MSGFVDKLHAAARRNGSLLCVGLDPDPALIPVDDVGAFNRAIVEATSDLVCAYKPNLGFFEALGRPGLEALEQALEAVPSHIPVIGDAKRGDIHRFYAKAMFETWGFDAATVHPYAGRDTIEHFLGYSDTMPMYEWVAMQAQSWNDAGNVGLVVGATYPDELRRVRELCPTLPILLPGVGAQQGALEASVENGVDENGRNLIVSASRSVLYASSDPNGYADAARREAEALRNGINAVLAERGLTEARS